MKICSKCKENKDANSGFYRNRVMKDRYANWCKACMSKIQKERYRYAGKPFTNLPNIPKEKVCSRCREIVSFVEFGKNRRRHDGLDSRCKKCLREKDRRCRAKKRLDPGYRVRTAVSSSVYRSIKNSSGSKGGESCFDYLPFSLSELISHLESQFAEGMSWDNYGKWHIDHIVPQSFFAYTSMKEKRFTECWSLKNLQPLWALDNISKNSIHNGKRYYYKGGDHGVLSI